MEQADWKGRFYLQDGREAQGCCPRIQKAPKLVWPKSIAAVDESSAQLGLFDGSTLAGHILLTGNYRGLRYFDFFDHRAEQDEKERANDVPALGLKENDGQAEETCFSTKEISGPSGKSYPAEFQNHSIHPGDVPGSSRILSLNLLKVGKARLRHTFQKPSASLATSGGAAQVFKPRQIPTLDEKIEAGMGMEDVVEHFIDSEYNIDVPILQSLLQRAIKAVDSAEETVSKEWGPGMLEYSTLDAGSVEESAPAKSEGSSAEGGLGEAVMWMAMASDSSVGAGALKGTFTTTKKSPPKQKGGKLPDRKEAVQTFLFDTPVQEQSPRVQATKRGRGGKTVTVVGGLKLKPESLEALAKQLKALCGAGGAVKEGCVEIQGDHTKSINEKLISLGYKSKVSGK
ncbi:translation initiation factor SUI1 [Klebsormidium nitens]|uniref:Translation initiation factor SUI1 n=1 Tax=Klebsormidium nitens TaxID=105231 RepID=A0A1Y1HPK7_KLENI|nr:translation initiation factor SUI1 [Klebsormidium nitens]|eukprot:GAQ78517.1 translation initiation factor SUI1 [Klebsormidium nitens]